MHRRPASATNRHGKTRATQRPTTAGTTRTPYRTAPSTPTSTTPTNNRTHHRRRRTDSETSISSTTSTLSASRAQTYNNSNSHSPRRFTQTTTTTTTNSNDPLLQEAARKERINNISSSLPILEDELELRPVNPRLPAGARNSTYFFFLGFQHRLRGNFSAAVVSLTRSITADPSDYRPRVNRAYALSRVGRHHDALKDLEMAAALSPNLPENYYNLGLHYQSRTSHKKAIYVFTHALELLRQRLCPPWTLDRRQDAGMYLLLRKSTYKSRALSLRQER